MTKGEKENGHPEVPVFYLESDIPNPCRIKGFCRDVRWIITAGPAIV
jgi:hypothetical protein